MWWRWGPWVRFVLVDHDSHSLTWHSPTHNLFIFDRIVLRIFSVIIRLEIFFITVAVLPSARLSDTLARVGLGTVWRCHIRIRINVLRQTRKLHLEKNWCAWSRRFHLSFRFDICHLPDEINECRLRYDIGLFQCSLPVGRNRQNNQTARYDVNWLTNCQIRFRKASYWFFCAQICSDNLLCVEGHS